MKKGGADLRQERVVRCRLIDQERTTYPVRVLLSGDAGLAERR